MYKFLMIFGLFTSLSSLCHAQFYGDQLINYFGSSCPSTGDLSHQALNDSRVLMTILQEIQTDQNCQTVAGAINELNYIQNKLQLLESDYNQNVEVAKLEAQEVELLNQIARTTDENLLYELELALSEVQRNKVSMESSLAIEKRFQGQKVKDIYSQIVYSSDVAFKTIVNNQLCLDRYPQILSSLASLSGSIASSVSAINPALGLGIAASTNFLGKSVENFRNRRFARRLRKIADKTTLKVGYQCVMEALTNRLCELDDSERFVKLKARLRTPQHEIEQLKSVILFNDREIPVLLSWLNQVRAGVPASTAADAGRQSQVFFREASVRSLQSFGAGEFTERQPLFESATTADAKWSIQRLVISNLIDRMGNNSIFFQIRQSQYAPFYLLGLPSIPVDGGGAPYTFASFDPFEYYQRQGQTFTPSLKVVKDNFDRWVQDAQTLVNDELRIVFQPDSIGALSSVFEPSNNQYKISAKVAIERILEFIRNNKPERFTSDVYKLLYLDTFLRLKTINDAIDNAIIDESIRTEEALRTIFDESQLQYGITVIQGRLNTVVRLSILEMLSNVDTSSKNQLAQLLAADSFVDVLQRTSGRDNLALIAQDLRQAKSIAISNMMSFSEIFGDSINKLFKQEQKYIYADDSYISESYRNQRAALCTLLVSLPQWPKNIDKKYCIGFQIKSFLQGAGVNSKLITYELLNKPFEDRMCLYRDYLRANRIYQDWGISL